MLAVRKNTSYLSRVCCRALLLACVLVVLAGFQQIRASGTWTNPEVQDVQVWPPSDASDDGSGYWQAHTSVVGELRAIRVEIRNVSRLGVILLGAFAGYVVFGRLRV